MAEHPPNVQFEDVPLDDARRMSRAPRMDPELYQALKDNLHSLDNTATRMTIADGTSQSTMKNRILRIAKELNVPVTIRRVPGGLIFWRSSEEDLQHAQTGPPPRAPAAGHPLRIDIRPSLL